MRTIFVLFAALALGCGSDSPVCGDGNMEGLEECDLGAANSDQGSCTTSCLWARCGDGLLSSAEACDDGNLDDGDACPAACTICGDGQVDGSEVCDTGGVDDGECGFDCQPSGTLRWSRALPAAPVGIGVASGGGFYVLTRTTLARYDAVGEPVWERSQPLPTGVSPQAFDVAADGKMLVVGYAVDAAGTSSTAWAGVLDPAGVLTWSTSVTAPRASISLYSCAWAPDGRFAIGGTLDVDDFAPGEAFARTFSPDGASSSDRIIDNPDVRHGELASALAFDGGELLVAVHSHNVGFEKARLLTPERAITVNARAIKDIAIAPDGSRVLGGAYWTLGGGDEAWYRAYRRDGEPLWGDTFRTDGVPCNVQAVVPGDGDTVYLAGAGSFVVSKRAGAENVWTERGYGNAALEAIHARDAGIVMIGEAPRGAVPQYWLRAYVP